MEAFWSQLSNYGFPIILSIYLLVRLESKMEALTQSILSLSQSLQKG